MTRDVISGISGRNWLQSLAVLENDENFKLNLNLNHLWGIPNYSQKNASQLCRFLFDQIQHQNSYLLECVASRKKGSKSLSTALAEAYKQYRWKKKIYIYIIIKNKQNKITYVTTAQTIYWLTWSWHFTSSSSTLPSSERYTDTMWSRIPSGT